MRGFDISWRVADHAGTFSRGFDLIQYIASQFYLRLVPVCVSVLLWLSVGLCASLCQRSRKATLAFRGTVCQ